MTSTGVRERLPDGAAAGGLPEKTSACKPRISIIESNETSASSRLASRLWVCGLAGLVGKGFFALFGGGAELDEVELLPPCTAEESSVLRLLSEASCMFGGVGRGRH